VNEHIAQCESHESNFTNPASVPSYLLSPLGRGKPSSVHFIFGVGLPDATHFSETSGPG
jgi:hypothetical protein